MFCLSISKISVHYDRWLLRCRNSIVPRVFLGIPVHISIVYLIGAEALSSSPLMLGALPEELLEFRISRLA